MKTNMTVSLDADVCEACKDRRFGFASKVCNDALRVAMELSDAVEKVQAKKQVQKIENGKHGVYVRGVGWVKEKEMI